MPAKNWHCALLATALTTSFASPALADESRWIVRGTAAYSVVADDQAVLVSSSPAPAETVIHRITDGAGISVEIEYMWTDRIGLEIAAIYSFHDSEGRIENAAGTFDTTDNMDLSTYTYGANYHFATAGSNRWSVGAFIPVMFSSDADLIFSELDRTEVFRFDQDYGFGAKLAFDHSFGSDGKWSLNVALRYMALILESEEPGGDFDVNPLVLTAGVGYRF